MLQVSVPVIYRRRHWSIPLPANRCSLPDSLSYPSKPVRSPYPGSSQTSLVPSSTHLPHSDKTSYSEIVCCHLGNTYICNCTPPRRFPKPAVRAVNRPVPYDCVRADASPP